MTISKDVVRQIKLCTVAVALDLGPQIHPKILGTGFMINDKGYCLTNSHVAKALLTPIEYLPFYDIPNPHGFKIDATSNPGNSGSPVLSREGKVIGIVYAKRTEAFTYAVVIKDIYSKIIEEVEKLNSVKGSHYKGQIKFGQQYKVSQEFQSEIINNEIKKQGEEGKEKG